MAFISFALTKNEFLSGEKTVTRRDWKPGHTKNWQKWYDEGKLIHDAWDKGPFAGGKKIGRFQLTCRPYLEKLCNMPVSDLEAEGGMCETVKEFCDFVGKNMFDVVTVIRFRRKD
jgi:hypothetical protein